MSEPSTISALKLTRRSFLALCLAGCTQLNRRPSFTPRDDTWALLSDTHIHADLTRRVRGACMAENLCSAVDGVLGAAPDGVLVNGDVAFARGAPEDYTAFLRLVAPLRAAGMAPYCTPGNHDDRTQMGAVLGLGRDSAVAGKAVCVFSAGGLRWVLLDSLDRVDGVTGSLGAAQREWLTGQLDADAHSPTVICLHHNPERSLIGLEDTDEFVEVVRPRRQVKLVLFGHTHEFRCWQADGLHFVNLPALGFRINPAASLGWLRAGFEPGGVRLEFVGVTPRERDHGAIRRLTWRSAG